MCPYSCDRYNSCWMDYIKNNFLFTKKEYSMKMLKVVIEDHTHPGGPIDSEYTKN